MIFTPHLYDMHEKSLIIIVLICAVCTVSVVGTLAYELCVKESTEQKNRRRGEVRSPLYGLCTPLDCSVHRETESTLTHTELHK
jgi:hypothetical protein